MPLHIDLSHYFSQKQENSARKSRANDERIVELETENALLHLRLVQLERELQSVRKERDNHNLQLQKSSERRQIHNGIAKGFLNHVHDLRCSLHELKKEVAEFPSIMMTSMQPMLHQAGVLDQQLQCRNVNIRDLQLQFTALEEALQDMQEKYQQEKKRRKDLHNTLVELYGNIRVHCRVRPVIDSDAPGNDTKLHRRPDSQTEEVVHALDDETLRVQYSRSGNASSQKLYEFERVFGPGDHQDVIFADVKPFLTSLLDGYNVCMMAYGQTGSGKTYTMLGGGGSTRTDQSDQSEGVIPRAAKELFRLLGEKSPTNFSLEVSVVEIYNNEIRDLLSAQNAGLKHSVFVADDGSMEMQSVSLKPVYSAEELIDLVQMGMVHRHEDATLIHSHSSRSHLVVSVTVTSVHSPMVGTMRGEEMVRTKLQLVDLAGSECVGMSGVTGVALRETSHINRSLSALSDVLTALAEHRTHIPYRNSRLTHLLQDSIGGDAKLLIMCCVSPTKRYLSETMQCLGFGSRARQVQRGPPKKRYFVLDQKTPTGRVDFSPVGTMTPRARSLDRLSYSSDKRLTGKETVRRTESRARRSLSLTSVTRDASSMGSLHPSVGSSHPSVGSSHPSRGSSHRSVGSSHLTSLSGLSSHTRYGFKGTMD